MTDNEKDEILSIVRQELWNMLQETRNEIKTTPNMTAQQLVDKLISDIERRQKPR